MYGIGCEWRREKEGMKLDLIDIKRAFFHALAFRAVFVNLPEEDYQEGMCGKLNKSMYGTRDAAQNWEREYIEFMASVGFVSGISTPCVFYNAGKKLGAVIHGDDFTLLGNEENFDFFSEGNIAQI